MLDKQQKEDTVTIQKYLIRVIKKNTISILKSRQKKRIFMPRVIKKIFKFLKSKIDPTPVRNDIYRMSNHLLMIRDGIIMSNTNIEEEMKLIHGLVADVCIRSKWNLDVIDFCLEYNRQKYDDSKDRSPTRIKIFKTLIGILIFLVVVYPAIFIAQSTGSNQFLQAIKEYASLINWIILCIVASIELYVNFYEDKHSQNHAVYRLVIRILELSKCEVIKYHANQTKCDTEVL